METLIPLDLPPGLARNGTAYQNRHRWIDGHLIRFHEGTIRPVGGWALVVATSGAVIDATGFPRASHAWRKNDGSVWLAVGTTGTPSKLYAYSSGVLTDITPAGLTNGVADGTLVTGSGAYGEGGYGDGPYGGAGQAGAFADADTWSLDNFGETLVACLTADGKIYSSVPTTQAAQVTNSPTGVRAIVVTPERFLFALGTSADPRLVAWASQETLTTWTPTATNSAGDFPLSSSGRLIAGRRMARETLLFTDADVWGAVYIGGQLIYSFVQRGDNCGLLGPQAVAIAEGAAYWMGDGQFWRYDGAVREIPCSVGDYVFGDLNRTQRAKICAVPIPEFGEVWWFYPSASQSTLENDRYVALNYRAGFWMTGNLGRSSGVGAGVFADPQMWDANGRLYTHENGDDRGGEQPFLESGPLEIGDGERVVQLQKFIADERTLGQSEVTFFASFQPMGTESTFGPYSISAETDVRLTARQVRLRLAETGAADAIADGTFFANGEIPASPGSLDFRIGRMKLGVVGGGRR